MVDLSQGAQLFAGVGGGFVIGLGAGKLLDAGLNTQPVQGLVGLDVATVVKKYGTPMVLMGIGLAGYHFTTNNLIKYVAAGVGAAGFIRIINTLMGKNYLAGLAVDDEALKGLGSADNQFEGMALADAQFEGLMAADQIEGTEQIEGLEGEQFEGTDQFEGLEADQFEGLEADQFEGLEADQIEGTEFVDGLGRRWGRKAKRAKKAIAPVQTAPAAPVQTAQAASEEESVEGVEFE